MLKSFPFSPNLVTTLPRPDRLRRTVVVPSGKELSYTKSISFIVGSVYLTVLKSLREILFCYTNEVRTYIPYRQSQNLIKIYVFWLSISICAPLLHSFVMWDKIEVDTSTAIGHISLTKDTNSNPHIIYEARYGTDKYSLNYSSIPTGKTLSSSTDWYTHIITTSSLPLMYTSLKLDSTGTPYVGFYDSEKTEIRYAKFTPTAGWTVYTVEKIGATSINTLSLCIDTSGYIHLSYYTSTQGLKYANNITDVWIYSIVDNNAYVYNSLSLDKTNLPHLVYYTYDLTLNYARRNSSTGNWDKEPVDIEGDTGTECQLVLDNNNQPHVVYELYDISDRLKYATRINNTWVKQMVDNDPKTGNNISLSIDSFNRPHISYTDNTNKLIKYASLLAGTTWSLQTVDIVEPTGGKTGIIVDKSDLPQVVYLYKIGWIRYNRYLLSEATYRLNGYLLDDKQKPIANAVLTLSGVINSSTTTDTVGYYSFTNLPAGNYTLVPSYSGYTFLPSNFVYTPINQDYTDQNFIGTSGGTEQKFYIRGYVKDKNLQGISGARVTISGEISGSGTTYETGYYIFQDLKLGNYEITVSKIGYWFDPGKRVFAPLGANKDDQDFIGTLSTMSIRGYIVDSFSKPVNNVTVSLFGTSSATFQTDVTGEYQFTNLFYGNYTVEPLSTDYYFEPVNLSLTPLLTDVTSQNFIAYTTTKTVDTYSLSGYVFNPSSTPILGTQVVLSGLITSTRTVDVNGFYRFTNLPAGNYTIFARKDKYEFVPQIYEYISLSTSKEQQNFVGTTIPEPVYYSIKGKVKTSSGTGIAGVLLNLTGVKTTSYLTTDTGNYEFVNLSTGNYNLTSVKSGYEFTPYLRSYTPIIEDFTDQDFVGSTVAATTVYYIKGYITDVQNKGINDIPVKLIDKSTGAEKIFNTITDGYYEFLNLKESNYQVYPSSSGTGIYITPVHREFVPLNSNQDTVNFTVNQINVPVGQVKTVNNRINPTIVGEKTSIMYNLSEPGKVVIRIYTIDGTLVKTLFEDIQTAGEHLQDWTGKNLYDQVVGSGIYYVYIKGPGIDQLKKVAVVK